MSDISAAVNSLSGVMLGAADLRCRFLAAINYVMDTILLDAGDLLRPLLAARYPVVVTMSQGAGDVSWWG
jgi:hypothetical protein